MSRIGNKPIPVPSGVKIAMASDKIDVQGPKGKLSVAVPRGISFEQKEGVLNVKRESDEQRAVHGLARALVANAVHGVTQGFKKEMDIVGVGYRAELKGKAVAFALGKSHPIEFKIPEGIQIAVDKQTHLIISGADKGRSARWRRISGRCAHRSLQAKGNSHYGRAPEEEGWQGGSQGWRGVVAQLRLKEKNSGIRTGSQIIERSQAPARS